MKIWSEFYAVAFMCTMVDLITSFKHPMVPYLPFYCILVTMAT